MTYLKSYIVLKAIFVFALSPATVISPITRVFASEYLQRLDLITSAINLIGFSLL